MRRWLEAMGQLLIPDAAGQRAIEETRADWREARRQPRTRAGRILLDIQGVVAILRVFVMLTWTQGGSRDMWRSFGASAALAAVLAAVATALTVTWPGNPVTVAFAAPAMFVSMFVLVMPLISAIGPGLRRVRAVPILGEVAVTAILVVILTGWVIPAANQYFRIRVWTTFAGGRTPPAPGVRELSLPKLWQSEPGLPGKGREFGMRAALVLAGPAFLCLGGAVRRRVAHRRSVGAAQLAGGLAALAAFVAGILVGRPWADVVQVYLVVAIAGLFAAITTRFASTVAESTGP